jgi:ferric-dicitrate binding protein FerR (iron transport regulator)
MTDTNDYSQWIAGEDESATVRLLRLAGPRRSVPADRAERVRAAVHAEWQIRNRRRAVRRRLQVGSLLLATAAAVVLIVGRLGFRNPVEAPSGDRVAVVEQIDGASALAAGDPILSGGWIETGSETRIALRFSDGTSVRLDSGSRARPLAATAIELAAGAAYVDTGRESGRFEVRTALATARDVGTQFEVRLLDRTLRLRVRSGVVELRDGARSVSGREGTEVIFSETGAVSRPVAVYGSEWNWAARVSRPPDIEGLALSAFLERVARDHGWSVHYADAALAREAAGIILHGSVKGLLAPEAVAVAITTSGLEHRLEKGELVVVRGRDAK